jgi:hypothetical protein
VACRFLPGGKPKVKKERQSRASSWHSAAGPSEPQEEAAPSTKAIQSSGGHKGKDTLLLQEGGRKKRKSRSKIEVEATKEAASSSKEKKEDQSQMPSPKGSGSGASRISRHGSRRGKEKGGEKEVRHQKRAKKRRYHSRGGYNSRKRAKKYKREVRSRRSPSPSSYSTSSYYDYEE